MLACVRFGRLLTFYGGHLCAHHQDACLCTILSTVTYTHRRGGGLQSDFLRSQPQGLQITWAHSRSAQLWHTKVCHAHPTLHWDPSPHLLRAAGHLEPAEG